MNINKNTAIVLGIGGTTLAYVLYKYYQRTDHKDKHPLNRIDPNSAS